MIFLDYEVIQIDTNDEDNNNLIKSNLPNNALVFVRFHNDGDGSRTIVYMRDNFATSDVDIPIAWHALSTGTEVLSHSNFASKGSDLYYNASNFSTGRTYMDVHILYLPEF